MVQRQACLLDFVPHPVADASAPFGTLHNFLLLQWHCCIVPRRGCLRLRIKFYFPCFFRSGTSQLLLLFLPPFFLATSGWIRFFFFFSRQLSSAVSFRLNPCVIPAFLRLLLYFPRLCSVLLLVAVFFAAKNRAILCYGHIMVRNFLLQLLVVLVSPFFLRNFNTPGFSYWWQLCRRSFIVFFSFLQKPPLNAGILYNIYRPITI